MKGLLKGRRWSQEWKAIEAYRNRLRIEDGLIQWFLESTSNSEVVSRYMVR